MVVPHQQKERGSYDPFNKSNKQMSHDLFPKKMVMKKQNKIEKKSSLSQKLENKWIRQKLGHPDGLRTQKVSPGKSQGKKKKEDQKKKNSHQEQICVATNKSNEKWVTVTPTISLVP